MIKPIVLYIMCVFVLIQPAYAYNVFGYTEQDTQISYGNSTIKSNINGSFFLSNISEEEPINFSNHPRFYDFVLTTNESMFGNFTINQSTSNTNTIHSGGAHFFGQSFRTENNQTKIDNISAFINIEEGVGFALWDNVHKTKLIKSVEFEYLPCCEQWYNFVINESVLPDTDYYFELSMNDMNGIMVYHNNSNPYPNGAMYHDEFTPFGDSDMMFKITGRTNDVNIDVPLTPLPTGTITGRVCDLWCQVEEIIT